jgi:uncharacterized protein YndB with AHSA1/START domain
MLDRPGLTIRRRIKAAPAAVFAAWTRPERLSLWFPTRGSEVLLAEADARVGGTFRIASRAPDGERFEVGGTYREVVPDRRLVFTWAWHTTPERESLVTVDLAPEGDGTVLTLHHEQFFNEAARDGHAQGWGQCLDALAALLA